MQRNGGADWPPTRESLGSWLRRHSAVVGFFAVLAVAVVSIFSLVVAESRLRSLDSDEERAGTATSSTTAARATTVPSGPPSATGLASGILDATNTDRINAGLDALRWNPDLAGSAQLWANTMAAKGTLGSQDLSPILDLGYHSAAENVLVGPATISADSAVAGWMNSATHRATIHGASYTDIGIGVATGADGRVWIAVTFAG